MTIEEKLIHLVERLYAETESYLTNQSDAQLWYNRGYANGVVKVLIERQALAGFSPQLKLDESDLHSSERLMEWHKAYHHGYEMGESEAREVLPG